MITNTKIQTNWMRPQVSNGFAFNNFIMVLETSDIEKISKFLDDCDISKVIRDSEAW